MSVGYIGYPDGGGELYGVAAGRRSPRSASAQMREERKRREDEAYHGPVKAAEWAAERKEARQRRSDSECARRARSNVRRLCRTYALTHMVTLTFPGDGVHDYDTALRLTQHFIHDHGAKVHLGAEWLAVPELHPRGHGWHWHVLVTRRFTRPELAQLRSGWTDYLTRKGMPPSGGARYVRVNVKQWGSSEEAAGYAAKYVTKVFEGDDRAKGRKRYLRPTRLSVPVVRGGANSLDEVRDAISQLGPRHVFESKEDEEWLGPPMVWASLQPSAEGADHIRDREGPERALSPA